jgi:hypothetical protein
MGAEIRPDLETCLELTDDVETQTRLRDLLAALPKPATSAAKATIAFDGSSRGGARSATSASPPWWAASTTR